jgi:D-glycero-D-manno-heptose 1,7-bisphosphate phosphatase
MERKAVFLDRDGVINVRLPGGAYVTRWEEFDFCEGVPEALRMLQDAGYLLVVVTNQRGVARGLMTEEDLEEIHRRMREELARERVVLEAVYFCPHGLDAGCRCRKPLPGMIEKAVEECRIDTAASLIIGDSPSDMEAGQAAGVRGLFITSSLEETPAGYMTAPSLLSAARAVTGGGR